MKFDTFDAFSQAMAAAPLDEFCSRRPTARHLTPSCSRSGCKSAIDHIAMALTLSRTQVQALESTTEGWIAGLQLAAVSLRDEPDPDAFIASFSGSHRFVLDYLLEEVLDRQPPGLTRFLLETLCVDVGAKLSSIGPNVNRNSRKHCRAPVTIPCGQV